MAKTGIKILGLDELTRAIIRQPRKFLRESQILMVRVMAVYRKGIIRSPWGVSSTGGGSPVGTGNLRDTHNVKITGLTASLYPTASYAQFVHDGTRRMKKRPWLDFVRDDKQRDVDDLLDKFLKDMANDLSK